MSSASAWAADGRSTETATYVLQTAETEPTTMCSLGDVRLSVLREDIDRRNADSGFREALSGSTSNPETPKSLPPISSGSNTAATVSTS